MDIRVYESKTSTAWLLAAGSVLLGLFILSSAAHDRGAQAIWNLLFGLGVVLYGGIYFSLEALRPRRLRVTSEALLFEKGGKLTTTLAWRDLEGFVAVRRRSLTMLGYRLRKDAPKSMGARLNRLFEGADGILYGFWPKSAKEMAAMLTVYLESLRDLEPAATQPPIVAAPAPAPRSAPVAVQTAEPTVSAPRPLFGRRAAARDPSGGKPIVW